MNRFASVASNARSSKLNVDGLCRCCGLEHEELYPIIGENPFTFDEVNFSTKYTKLLGLMVESDDELPQNICSMCADKINDFYEFYLMAENTESTTRQTLGLPKIPKSKNKFPSPAELEEYKNLKSQIKNSQSIINDLRKELLRSELETKKQRLILKMSIKPDQVDDALSPNSTKKVFCIRKRESKSTNIAPPAKKAKFSCKICVDKSFSGASGLDEHLSFVHKANIAVHGCASCHETFNHMSELKAHQGHHTKMKLPYSCFQCGRQMTKFKEFNTHMMKNCPEKIDMHKIVEDIKCFQCKKKFLTQNLFEWHNCFVKTKGNCIKCGRYFAQKKTLFKHYLSCDLPFFTPEYAMDPIKIENEDSSSATRIVKKSSKKIVVSGRRISTPIVKSEVHFNENSQEFDDEMMNYNDGNFNDDFQNNDSDDEIPLNPIEPIIKMETENDTRTVKIKTEKTCQSAIQQRISDMIRSIKQEQVEPESVIEAEKNSNNQLKVKIKAEKQNSDGPISFKYLNPLAVKTKQAEVGSSSKKVFKISPALLAKIKKEKIDNQERDEAEPEDEDLFGAPMISNIKKEKIDEPERDNFVGGRDEAEADDEDLLQGLNDDENSDESVVKIKKEKMDSGYGDKEEITKKKPSKQFINPLAAVAGAAKNAQKSNENNSLVISSVTSINQDENLKSSENLSDETFKTNPMIQIPNHCLPNREDHDDATKELDNLLERYEKTGDCGNSSSRGVDGGGGGGSDIFDDLLANINGGAEDTYAQE